MKKQFVFQRKQRYFYDRCYVVPGGELVIVGDEAGCAPEQVEAAITNKTAGIGYVDKTRREPDSSVVSIDEAMEIGRRHGVPVIVDAAYQTFPLQKFRWIAGAADLVCFGGKYVGAASSTGFLCGRADLAYAASRQGFVASQSGDRPRSFGRSMKVDRQEIIGMVVALEEWLTMDHEDRVLRYLSYAKIIQDAVDDIADITTQFNRLEKHSAANLTVKLEPAALGMTGHTVAERLAADTPRILVGHDDSWITIALHTLHDGHPEVIAERLRAILQGEECKA